MKIKNYDFRFIIIFNLVFLSILYTDYFLPTNIKIEKIKSFYNAVNYTPGFKSGRSKEIKYILECENNNKYYLGKFPQEFENIKKGTKISIEQTIVLKKTKSVKIDRKNYNISFLSLSLVIYIFAFCILINVLNIFFTNKLLDVLLSISTAPIYFIGLVYIFSY